MAHKISVEKDWISVICEGDGARLASKHPTQSCRELGMKNTMSNLGFHWWLMSFYITH